jgi:LPS sulfotransferase NodH
MIHRPTKSYLIWFSQRVGSTLLAQTLEDTGLAGRPREWFNAPDVARILTTLGVADGPELRELLWRDATTPNGVLGIKCGIGPALYEELGALFGSWDAVLPNCKHLFMTRRNKVRLAVSWWRAIKTEEWHRPNRFDPPTAVGDGVAKAAPPNPVDLYHYAAIDHLLIDANLREAEMQERFDRLNIVPHTIVYEDFIASYEATIRDVLRFLEIEESRNIRVPPPAFDRLADEVSERWYERFISERRATLGKSD